VSGAGFHWNESTDVTSSLAKRGYADGLRVIARAAWLQPVPANAGVVVYGADEQPDARGC
jgi:hypothetical protein